jgi:hypothetical protein
MIYIYPIPAQLKRYAPITIPAMMLLEDSLDIIPQVIIAIVEVQSTKVVIECCFGHPLQPQKTPEAIFWP